MGGGCETFRDAISARLDGEEIGPGDALDRHLDGCADCRAYAEDAALVTRMAALSGGGGTFAGVDDSVLDALPAPRRRFRMPTLPAAVRRSPVPALRVLLGLLGAGQFVLGVAQITGIAAVQHLHTGVGGASANHLLNESAAWNLALGAGFAWIAMRRGRPSGILPTLTVFVSVLVLLSAGDLVAGRVEPVRLLSHGLVLAGYLVVVALTRTAPEPGEPPAGRRDGGSRWRLSLDTDPDSPAAGAPGRLRVLPGGAAMASASASTDARAA
ncbi:zf-HC2 domain-containing protein [Catenuloplanes atrovinosus]|uniref:Anti-sigma-YlaC factor YlaD n=1 Tax=Catenuloplanes atrovinosus TaxID=137266 RepID=A0AAE4C918_9ACTN|nr:zf-HC2 domain-containing protein [Catenuloplanes atrovinosus]MDR7274364.1 putative anti-sigma-YlaC factor YlaD [Catenuloplanes atrovinosus]